MLAGYLSPKDRPRPGRVRRLPLLERIAVSFSTHTTLMYSRTHAHTHACMHIITLMYISMQPLGTSVLCLQCDERKIVAGCADRLIRVYDIRTARLVSILSGHTVRDLLLYS